MEEEPKKSLNVDYYIEMMLNRRWCILIPFCISLIVGITLSIRLPRSYMASTLIMVEPQRVSPKYVQPLVDSDIEKKVVTLQEQVMSRTNLERIIDKLNMFSGKEYEKMFLEDKVAFLRRKIIVKVTKEKRGADAFSISYEGNYPELVMNVVNELATSFIDENLKNWEERVLETVKFLNEQLANERKKLSDVEENMKDFKQRYHGELPEQLDSNQKALDRLQLKIADRNMALRDAKNRLAELDEKIPKESEKVVTLNKLKEQYESVSLRYTSRHPDVIRLKKMVADLEAEIVKEAEAQKISEKYGMSEEKMKRETDAAKARPGTKTEIQEKRNKILKEVAAIEEEISKSDTEAEEYERRIDITPKREQEMTEMKRDYENIKKHYSDLLNRKLEADIAMDMERRAKGEQFRILDKAGKPEKPVFPDVRKLLLISVVAGLGAGIGIAFLLDFMDNTLKRAEDVEPLLDIPVMITIPKIYNQKDQMKCRINQMSGIASVLLACALLAIFAVLAIKGVGPTLAVVKKLIGNKI